MRHWLKLVVGVSALCVGWNLASARDDGPPPWAWGFTTPAPNTPPAPRPPGPPRDNVKMISVQGSKFQFTEAQILSRTAPADWFPEDHPVMPDVVAHGREAAQIQACGLCHRPNGVGRPENANVAGLPYAYIVQQMHDFRAGLRQTSDPRKTNTALMEVFAKAMTDEEIHAAAAYFSALPVPRTTKVVEAKTTPKTKMSGGLFIALEGAEAGTEALGNRIIEMPVNAHDFEVTLNPRQTYIAYVPPGSLKKGKNLVKTGAGKVTPCVACHGADLRGLGPIPRLAGRSPIYLVRQLYDMQHGNRVGAWSPLMAPVLGNMNEDDILVAAAYLGSLEP